ncbi:MAG TPA: ABC transporter permease [Bryobacteraceae bacterium]|nr:ABC transporter permease [Bryobacteraceae bacterium]
MTPSNEIEEELLFHIEARAADLQRRGRSPQQALRQARLEMGSIPRYVEEGREAKGLYWRDTAVSIYEAILRFLRRDPLFHLLTVLTLALGIGGATLTFSVAHRLLAGAVPYPDTSRLFSVRVHIPLFASLYPDLPVSASYYAAWRRTCTACEELALLDSTSLTPGGQEAPVPALRVTPGFFPLTGITPVLGRAFRPGEEGPSAPRVVLLTHHFWQQRFHGDPSIVGRTIPLDGASWEIIGVLPAGAVFPRGEQSGELMHFPPQVDLVIPQTEDGSRAGAEEEFRWALFVKLRSGAAVEEARRQLEGELQHFHTELRPQIHAGLTPLVRQFALEAYEPLLLLGGAAIAMLLIVCVSFGSIQLARMAARRRDLAIRSALGASRGSLLRHALGEGMTLAAAGALAGATMAWGAIHLLRETNPVFLPPLDGATLYLPAWALSASAVFAVGAACTAIPLLRYRPVGNRRGLLFCAAAGSVALSAAAGWLFVNYVRVRDADHGFEADRLTSLCFRIPPGTKDAAAQQQMLERVLRNIRAIPSVEAAAAANRLPLIGEARIDPVRRPGAQGQGTMGNWRHVTAGYFGAAGTTLVAGRDFSEQDRGKYVAIISERVAREQFPGENPIGKNIEQPEADAVHMATVIGVAEDVKTRRISWDAPLLVYLPFWQRDPEKLFYLVRTKSGHPDPTEAAIRAAEAEGMETAREHIFPMRQLVEQATGVRRWHALWTVGFALTAVLTACLGLFTTVRDNVSRRTAEIGVRMALGATPFHTARLLLRESLRPVWLGAATGMAAALLLGRLFTQQLSQITPYDAAVAGVAALAVAIAATAAAYLSIRKAVQIDPVAAIRAE